LLRTSTSVIWKGGGAAAVEETGGFAAAARGLVASLSNANGDIGIIVSTIATISNTLINLDLFFIISPFFLGIFLTVLMVQAFAMMALQ